jgi:hypothetical protein
MTRSASSGTLLAGLLASLAACQVSADGPPSTPDLAAPTVAGEPKVMQGFFDPREWVVRKTIAVDLGGHLTNATAILLSSVIPKGESGVGAPLFAVDMLIVSGRTVLYQFYRPGAAIEFLMDDALEARDVTNDGIPEVLFHSGFVGASDFSKYEHVIYRVPGEEPVPDSEPFPSSDWVNDVAPVQFIHTRRQTLRWLDLRGVTLAVVANPLIPAGVTDPHFCHGCPHFYQYLVFRWEKTKGTFVLSRSIQSQRDFEDGTDPLRDDLGFVLGKLDKECE